MLLKLYLMKGIKKCVKAAVFDFRENSLHAQKCVMGHFWAQIQYFFHILKTCSYGFSKIIPDDRH